MINSTKAVYPKLLPKSSSKIDDRLQDSLRFRNRNEKAVNGRAPTHTHTHTHTQSIDHQNDKNTNFDESKQYTVGIDNLVGLQLQALLAAALQEPLHCERLVDILDHLVCHRAVRDGGQSLGMECVSGVEIIFFF